METGSIDVIALFVDCDFVAVVALIGSVFNDEAAGVRRAKLTRVEKTIRLSLVSFSSCGSLRFVRRGLG
jgi:hypothetical protein